MYLDESGVNKYLKRERARSLRGTQILSPFCYRATCHTDLFNMWLKDFFIPELKPGQVVILDNAAFHKSQNTKQLIEEAGCRMFFLPPYSPDVNRIELVWANLKKKTQGFLEKIHRIKHS